MEAGEMLFRDHGFDAVTVEQVAETADVAKGTFFNYFESKETLLGALLIERTQSLLDEPPGDDKEPVDRIRTLFAALREELAPYVHLFPRMFAYAVTHPQAPHPAADRPALWQALAEIVQDGQDVGVFREDLDPQIAGVMLSTYFFRISILECMEEEKERERGGECECEGYQHFCWGDRVDAGIEILYHGMLASNNGEEAPPS
jgi:AcrR family transcriptional regulator